MPFGWLSNATVQYMLDALGRIEQRQVTILATLNRMELSMAAIDDALDAAEAAAEADSNAQKAAMGLLDTLAAQIAALSQGVTDPAVVARIQALATGLKSRAEALSEAVVARTPAATA